MNESLKNLSNNQDEFSFSPLFSVLPSYGKVNRLSNFTSSLFARYESLKTNISNTEASLGDTSNRAVNQEIEMLEQVLEWLSVSLNDSDENE